MELDYFKAFLTVAEAGGFRSAATRLHLTQPTVSRQIQALEAYLGAALFHRVSTRSRLTPFGARMIPEAKQLLRHLTHLREAKSSSGDQVSGVLRLGVADSVVVDRLPRILGRYTRMFPRVTLQVRTARSPEILHWVQEGECDVGLCMLPEAHPDLDLRVLWKDSLVAIAPKGTRFPEGRTSLAKFATHRQLVIRPDTLTYQQIVGAFRSAGLSLVPSMVLDSFHNIASFVAAGIGVGIVSRSAAGPFLREKNVVRVRIPQIDGLKRELGFVLPLGSPSHGPLAALLRSVGL